MGYLRCVLLLVLASLRGGHNSPLVSHNHRHHSPSSNTFSSSLLELNVVALLPSPSKRALSLSKTLSRTLNAVTAADLVNQLDFPEKNVTWSVSNFFITNPLNNLANSKLEKLVQFQLNSSNDEDEDSEMEEEDEEEEEEFQLQGDDGINTSEQIGRRNKYKFSPLSLEILCDFLSSKDSTVGIVSLLPDQGQKLLSLVSTATNVPFLAHSSVTTIKDEDELYINLSNSVRDLARALVQLLLSIAHFQWHTFTVLFDDSPSIRASQLMWEQELLKPNVRKVANNGSSYKDYELFGDGDEEEWDLRPQFLTIQTRFPNSAFRALSEVIKATQGVILLVLSSRSARDVFQAAKQLRMLNGDYIFIMIDIDPHVQFDKVPESWIPEGVLSLKSPKSPLLSDKKRMRSLGTAIATAVSQLKDQPFVTATNVGKGKEGVRMAGGVFSGFTNRDFQVEGELDFVGNENELPEVPKETFLEVLENLPNLSCFAKKDKQRKLVSATITREIKKQLELYSNDHAQMESPKTFDVLNLIRSPSSEPTVDGLEWIKVGSVSPQKGLVHLNTIKWPGGGIFGPGGQLERRPSKSYRVVTIVSPPFVMESQAENNETCVRGLPCLKVKSANKDDLVVLFADFDGAGKNNNKNYELACCDGLSIDLLSSVARELKFEIDLFLVPDGYFGSRRSDGSWNGLMGALVSGAAHLCFAPFSILSSRSSAVEFSTPFFFSGVSLLGISRERDVPVLAFLAPFSPTLWAAIFITLNLTALVVAIYEWFSPFGLNPWGRQRTKNFSISSALWVVWGRLFSHLVAFKAPKSWPNKFLINVWGGFSVIFVASYTANIAALFAGMFFERHVDVNDRSLLSQRVTAIKHSATDFYIKRENPHLWEHIQRFPVHSFQEGVQLLKNGSLDLLIGDGPLLDYYRGTDSSCNLIDVSDHDKIGDDSYAVAMTRGFPQKDSVSGIISKYLGNGYMDYLQGKWFGQFPCFSKNQQAGARALGVDAVVGMLIMLGLAIVLGIVILILELLIFKHGLPVWRAQPKGTFWRSPNVMLVSQKLYRFINCVELVSPHHAAKELAKTLRQGQITSLFQKSVKRKEHDLKRRRKSKAQFYEMIQEIKRVQMAEREGKSEEKRAISRPVVYSIQERMDNRDIYLPPRLGHLPGTGEEILIADTLQSYPAGERVGPQGAPSSVDDPPSTSASETTGTTSHFQRRIQWRAPRIPGGLPFHPYSSPPPPRAPQKKPQGILRIGGRTDAASSPDAVNKKVGAEGEDTDDEEEGEVSEDDSYELYSPLDKADLKQLTKNQIIELWRASELDLRRQLSQALKAKDELSVALSRSDTPAMLVEFDQVKL